MTQERAYIASYYDRQSEYEWERLDRHRTEFALTMRALIEHLPPPPASVLDCGGGPGRYALALARRGYEVTLFDLSAGNLCLARDKATQAGVALASYERGTATDLARFPDDAFEVVLLMGPLYHLLDERDRKQALTEARRVLKPGGHLFAAFISRYAIHRYVAAHEPTWPQDNADLSNTVLNTGLLPPRGEHGSQFVAHFAHPREVPALLRETGFEMATLLGVEGLVSMIEEEVNALSGTAWQTWVDLNYRIAHDPSTHGGVEHLLAVAVKPRWRAALRHVAQKLQGAQIPYKVVGGTSVALHGVQVAVQDLDLEMPPEDTYRFQDLFAAHVVEPVALRESAIYRSHFGRFDVDGVSVEVMGDLHHREGSQWVPMMARTTSTIDVDGTLVPVSWLEEETLAYVRRGRLERAAQCLPHCDRDRLLSLLCGECNTSVL